MEGVPSETEGPGTGGSTLQEVTQSTVSASQMPQPAAALGKLKKKKLNGISIKAIIRGSIVGDQTFRKLS